MGTRHPLRLGRSHRSTDYDRTPPWRWAVTALAVLAALVLLYVIVVHPLRG